MLLVAWQAWQSWKSAKAVALLATVALAIGIGSTTAIYTVVNAVMLRPLPYRDGDRFVALFSATLTDPKHFGSLAFPDLLAYQQRTQSFDVFGWFKLANFNLTSPGQPEHINGIEVTPSLANNLGVNPIIGRWFDKAGEPVALISHALWQRLGAKPDMVGMTIALNGRGYTVAGIMPAWFRLPIGGPFGDVRYDVWLPLDPLGKGQSPNDAWYFGYARLKPGVAFTAAEADAKRVAAQIAAENPASRPFYTARLEPLQDLIVKEIRPTLLLLFAAAGLLLLITCANVAGLLLARSVARARETAVRVALGAGRYQLTIQYFLEGLFVSLAGAAAGVVLSLALVRIVVSLAGQFIPRVDEIGIDWRVLIFALGAACLASALSSLAPLAQALRASPAEALSEGVRSSAGARSRRLSQSLVIAEIALAFTLLTVSALFIAHLRNLSRISPGFDPNQLLTFQLSLPDTIAARGEKRVPYQIRLTRALEAIPGISGAAFTNQLPLAGCCLGTTIYPEGRPADLDVSARTSYLPISPEYFQAMRIPLRSGRLLTYHDSNSDIIFAVINQAAARYFWRNQDPIGAYGRFLSETGSRFQVVGVVGDVRNDGLANPIVPEVYILNTVGAVNPMHFVVRSPAPVETLVPAIRHAVQTIDPTLPINQVATMNEIARRSLSLERVSSFMTAFFAFAALLLATLGVYGIVSYSVRQRTVEMGTRMALGAVGRDLLSLVVGGGLKMAAAGIAIGAVAIIVAAWNLLRVFEALRIEPLAFVYSTAIVAGIAIAASFFPAWRATLLSPMVAIRNETGSVWQTARRRIRAAVLGGQDPPAISENALLTDFTDAARRAASFREVLDIALAILRQQIAAESAMLLDNVGGREYRGDGCSVPAQGFLLNRLRSYTLPLPLTPGDFETWLRWAQENRPEHLAEIQTLQNTGARIAVALRARNEILGVLLLGPLIGGREYSAAQKRLLAASAGQFALMLENARLTDRVVEQEKLRRDLALAAEVQKRLLPRESPGTSLVSVSAVCLPARTVGGDYYDFIDLGDYRVGIALADIAGKGIAAALIMSVVQASLRVLAAQDAISLPELAARMNHFLYRSTRSNSYATFFYAQIDERNRELRYVNAGHNPPYLVRSMSEIEELSTGGTIIGMFPRANYEEAAIDLRPGDVLLAFTDGVTEALNPNEEEFGEERLKDLLRRVVHLPVNDICARIADEMKNWIHDAAQYDDLTFIVMKVN
jgi:predicted permease